MVDENAIAVVAKCPIAGKSKTRLMSRLGPEGSASLAKAMLSDVILTINQCSALMGTRKILLYAPATTIGLSIMQKLLEELGIRFVTSSSEAQDSEESWQLLPMIERDLQASDLGAILEDALRRIRQLGASHNVAFLGMDSPVIPLEDIVAALKVDSTALLCPAADGGYGMLVVPKAADPSRTFSRILWSHPLTAICQLKALSDQGISTQIGQVMYDIDESSDLDRLIQSIGEDLHSGDEPIDKSVLGGHAKNLLGSTSFGAGHAPCSRTKMALVKLGLVG